MNMTTTTTTKTPDAMKAAMTAVRKAVKVRGKDFSYLGRVAYETMVSHGYKPAVARDLALYVTMRATN